MTLRRTLRRGIPKVILVNSVRGYRDAGRIIGRLPKRERSKMKRRVKRIALRMFAQRGITGRAAMCLYRQGWQWASEERAKKHGAA